MNGDVVGVKKAAMNKVKQVASAATAAANPLTNGNKKRRKGQDLKPIITGEKENGSSGGETGGAPQTPAITTTTTTPAGAAATKGQKSAQRYF